MNFYFLPQLTGSIIILIMAFIILLYNKRNVINITFALACLSIFCYIFGMFVVFHIKTIEEGLFWIRFLHYGVILLPIFLYHCFSSFKINNKNFRKTMLIVGYLCALTLIILQAFNLLIKDLNTPQVIKLLPIKDHLLFLFHLGYTFFYYLSTCITIYRNYKTEKVEIKKKRNKLIFISLIVGTIGFTDYIPHYLNVKSWYPYGTITTFIFIVFFSYIILKYNIERYNKAIREKTLISVVNMLLSMIYVSLAYLLLYVLGYETNLKIIVPFLILFFIYILSYEKKRKRTKNIIIKIFFPNQYLHSEILYDYNKVLLTLLDINKIAEKTINLVKNHLNLKNCFVFVNNKQNDSNLKYIQIINDDTIETEKIISKEIVSYLKSNSEPITHENILEKNKKLPYRIIKMFEKYKLSACIPLFFKDNFIGMLNLEEKVTDEILNERDIQWLKIIGFNLSIAFHNAIEVEKEIEKEKDEIVFLKNEIIKIKQETGFSKIITQNRKMLEIMKLVKEVADTNATIMILGESGTGKELIANAIHDKSKRKNKPFIEINCAAIPAELLESELFGYEKGAFSGAYKSHKGKFEEANEGTIFLDEIGEMRLDLQSKLLRVLEEKTVEKIGSNKKINLDIRIVCATNRNLEKLVNENKFRNDLYYRLSVVNINLPPLRERKDDIKILLFYFIKKYSEENNKEMFEISEKALKALINYNWPGNIRELENLIYSIIITKSALEQTVEIEDLPKKIISSGILVNEVAEENEDINYPIGLKEIMEEIEMKIIKQAYEKSGKNQNKTARNLKMSLGGLQYKLKKYNIE